MDWEGSAVLITGGSRGIGLATAKRFLGGGASVMIAGRSGDALAAAGAELSCPERLRAVAADVSTVMGCRTATAAALDAFGRLDVLFTNAGNYEAAPVAEVTEEMWDRTIDTHLKGTFFCVQASEPALRATRGCVVTMASDAGLLGFRGGWAAYCAAMGGVINLTRQLAVDLAPEVRVNALAPGPVGTRHLYDDLESASYGGFEEAGDAVAAVTDTLPIRRILEPDEIARAALFLAGMESMTGSVMSVDGGTTIALP
jgi:meso-butanediol dehydrogenase/(S,S)-butanediol dehydrogenase/diacetyl reductase